MLMLMMLCSSFSDSNTRGVIVSFEPKAKNTFPSFHTQRSMSLHKMCMFETKLLRVHRSSVIEAGVFLFVLHVMMLVILRMSK
jgi:ABC-type phosphate transport system permease subunit